MKSQLYDGETEFTPGGVRGKVSAKSFSSVLGGSRQGYALYMMRLNCMAKTSASMWKSRQISNLYHKSIFSDHLSWHPLGFGLNFYKKYSLIIFSLACVILKVQGLNLDCTSVKEVGGRFVGCRKEEFQPAVGSVL